MKEWEKVDFNWLEDSYESQVNANALEETTLVKRAKDQKCNMKKIYAVQNENGF